MKQNDPVTVSVIVPTYNRAHLVMESINSVLDQTFRDLELIVLDDGSQDNTREVLEDLIKQNAIRYIYQKNAGLSAARNHALHEARGKYVAFLDSDDKFLPTKLEKQVKLLEENPQLGFVHTGFNKFDNNGQDLGYRDTSDISGYMYPHILLHWSVLIPPSCVMVPAQMLKDLGVFDESLDWAEDLDMWRRITRFYPIAMIPESLALIRVHQASVSSDKTKAADAFLQYLNNAFEEDPDLGQIFKRRAFAKMYTNVAHNLLGNGGYQQMRLVRQHSLEAIRSWPIEFGAYAGFIASFISPEIRARLVQFWRRWRYRLTNK